MQDVAWPSMAQTGQPGVRARWAGLGGRDHRQVHSPRAVAGRDRMARLPSRSSEEEELLAVLDQGLGPTRAR